MAVRLQRISRKSESLSVSPVGAVLLDYFPVEPTLAPWLSPGCILLDRLMSEIKSQIPGNFLGAKPGAQYELANGQVWAQAEDTRQFSYAYRPQVTIRAEKSGHVMHVSGADQSFRVLQVR